MRDSIHPNWRTQSGRPRLLAAAVLVSGFLLAGCGESSHSPAAGTVGAASTSASNTASAGSATTAASHTATGTGSSNSGPTAPGAGNPALAFAECMRSSGVPNFTDPVPGGELLFPVGAGINPSSPAFRAARAKCQKVLPGGGPPGPGATTHPSAQTVAKLVRIAECMRQHGISQFPDPRTSIPYNVAGIDEITDFDGVILLFPHAMNLQAPAYRQALAACGAPPLGLSH